MADNLRCHHQHQNYDPDDIVAKLQTKLRSIDATEDIIEHDKEDSVSINSSVSQDKYHQSCHHHHQHSHHHHHHHMHSGHETPKVNIIFHWSCLVAFLENYAEHQCLAGLLNTAEHC